MSLKKVTLVFSIWFIVFLGIGGVGSAASSDALHIDFSTDKESYQYEDEIISTITITNQSDGYSAENVSIETKLPKAFEVLGSDVEITEDGKVLWEVEKLERGESVELPVKIKLTQEELDRVINVTGDKEEGSDDTNNEGQLNDQKDQEDQEAAENNEDDDVLSGDKSEGEDKDETFIAPQTGDDTNLLASVLILIASVLLGLFAFIRLRKKRMPKSLSIILITSLLTPALSVAYAESGTEQNVQKYTNQHQLVIGDQSYDIDTSVKATVKSEQGEIPVTGTAYNEAGTLLVNEKITFSTNLDDKIIEEVVETDDEGYFVSRLFENATYDVSGSNLKASVVALDINEIKVTNDTGEIILGKTLRNGENFASLQPSVIYLNEDEATHFISLSNDLSTAKMDDTLDLQVGDIFVIPKWENYPSGIALYIKDISNDGENLLLQIGQPELEDIFTEIFGNMDVDISPEYFVPAEGVTVIEKPDTLSQVKSIQSDVESIDSERPEFGGELYLEVDDLVKVDGLSLKGTTSVSGYVNGDIEWRAGFNPFNKVDFNFIGDYQLDLELASKLEHKLDVELGRMTLPTPIPVLTVNIPVDFVTTVGGKVSVNMVTGSNLNYGIEYAHDSGIRTYPEENYTPYFSVSDVEGSAKLSAGLRLSVLAGLLGVDGFGVAGKGEVVGTATTSLIGSSALTCLLLEADFNGETNFSAPLFDWESNGSIGFETPIYTNSFGSCISAVEFNPQEIEIEPGETKSVEVNAKSISGDSNISNDPNLDFIVSDEMSIEKIDGEHPNKIDIHALQSARNGDVIEVEAVYDLHGTRLTDTLTVKVVDSRPKGEIIGKIVDAITDVPIEGVKVRILDGDDVVNHAFTANDGVYNVSLVPGTYAVEFSHDGYITDTSRLAITQGNTTTYDAKLKLVDNEHKGIGKASGQIQHAITGSGIPDVNIAITSGRNNIDGEVIKTVTTDQNGDYQVDLPGGNYTMVLTHEGYISATDNILAIGDKERTDQNATMSPDGIVADNLRIVLTWGETPRDLDSHLTGPKADSDRFHIYYSDKSFKDEANDVNLDRDDTTSYGPETVTLIKKMQMGTYVYAVHNYTGRYLNDNNQLDLTNSGAKVEVYEDDTLLATYPVPVDQAGNSWRVFEIRDGQIVPINQMETISSWRSAGSFAPIE